MRHLILTIFTIYFSVPVAAQECLDITGPSEKVINERRVNITGTACDQVKSVWVLSQKEGMGDEWSLHGKSEVSNGKWNLEITMRRMGRGEVKYQIAALRVSMQTESILQDLSADITEFDDPTIPMPSYIEKVTHEITLSR